MKTITVITTMYKGKKYLDNLLSNINTNRLNIQSIYHDIDVEYIIVNDDPTDKLEDISNVKVINNSENYGIHKSRAIAVKLAKGDYIQFLDQDDYLADDALLKQYENIKDNDVSLANGYEQYVGYKEPIYSSLKKHNQALEMKWYTSIGCMIISPGQCLIRKNSIPKKWLEHYLDYNCSDDYLLWLMMLEGNKKFVVNDYYAFYHNNTGENISGSFETCYRSNLKCCELARKYSLLSQKTIYNLERMSKMKLDWKIIHRNKMVLIFQYLDIFIKNLLYKVL